MVVPTPNTAKKDIKDYAQGMMDDMDTIIAANSNPALTQAALAKNRQFIQGMALHMKRMGKLFRDNDFMMYKK